MGAPLCWIWGGVKGWHNEASRNLSPAKFAQHLPRSIIFSTSIEVAEIIEGKMRIFKDGFEVSEKLGRVFGVSRGDLVAVVRHAVSGRADRVENDPINAAGQFMYIHGVRNIRALFRSKGWALDRKDNVELVTNLDRPLSLAYQSVDLACNPFHSPQAISGKGAGAERLLDEAQMSLPGLGPVAIPALASDVETGLWYLCISVGSGQEVRAELSLPTGVANGNFAGFRERIFLVEGSEWTDLRSSNFDRDHGPNFEPEIRRKNRA